MGLLKWIMNLSKNKEDIQLEKQNKISTYEQLASLGKVLITCENCEKKYTVLYPSHTATCPYCGLQRIINIRISNNCVCCDNGKILENPNPQKIVRENQENKIGVILGEPDTRTEEEIAALKRRYLHPDAQCYSDGVCSTGQADNERFIANNSNLFTQKVVYIATLDNNCCPLCWTLDGKIFPQDINKRPPVPRHENCRCLYLPKAKTWRDFGIDLDELPPVERPWILADYQYTYKRNPEKKLKKPRRTIRDYGKFQGTAEEWIKSLPDTEQRKFFPSLLAYNLWKSGKIKGIDLLNPKTWQLRSDEELRRLFS